MHILFSKIFIKIKTHTLTMNKLCKLSYLIVFSFLISCGGDDDGGPDVGGPTGPGLPEASASYDLTFTTNFTEANNPQDYPTNASFGTIIAITHAPEVSVFTIGQLASQGMALYAQSGDVEGLSSFISTSLGEEGDGLFSVVTAGMAGPQATTSTSISITPTRTRITFLARMNPSPDWFLGVSSFNVVNGETLIDIEEIELRPLDAGVILGDTYEANDGVENAAIILYDGAPFGNGNPLTEPVANLTIERAN